MKYIILCLLIILGLIRYKLPNLTIITACTVSTHFMVTLPSNIYHKLMDTYHRYVIVDYDKTPLIGEKVVIFVHGRNGHHADLTPLAHNLNIIINHVPINSLKNIHFRFVHLGSTGDTLIEEDVIMLKNQLEPYQHCDITLVGLSKGGATVATYYLTMNDYRINKVITISSPIMGTDVASAFDTDTNTYKALSSDNSLSLLMNIKAKDKNIYHIVPRWDHLIIPNTNAKYPNTDREHIYYYNQFSHGHSGICYDIIVAYKIAEWLI